MRFSRSVPYEREVQDPSLRGHPRSPGPTRNLPPASRTWYVVTLIERIVCWVPHARKLQCRLAAAASATCPPRYSGRRPTTPTPTGTLPEIPSQFHGYGMAGALPELSGSGCSPASLQHLTGSSRTRGEESQGQHPRTSEDLGASLFSKQKSNEACSVSNRKDWTDTI